MSLTIDKHIEFYKAEYANQLREWMIYVECSISLLISSVEREMYMSTIWGIQEKSGLLVLKIDGKRLPRLNQPYFFGILNSHITGNPREWRISYKDFRERRTNNYYSGMGDTFIPIRFWKSEGESSYLLCEILNEDRVQKIKERFLDKSIHPKVLIAEADPPLKYLENLKQFLVQNPLSPIANFQIPEKATWNPHNLDNSIDVKDILLDSLRENEITLVQGPPGTGKSYLAASIANSYILNRRSVLICSLANKALMEIAGQEPMKPLLNEGKVYKSNISNLERRQIPKLLKSRNLVPVQGQLLLTSYYALSDLLNKYEDIEKRFDLVIIEEASQAFLATIAMFSSFAQKTLIIGDQNQLPPVVTLEKRELKRIHPDLIQVVEGLKTFALNQGEGIFRLSKTRRLTDAGATQTGLFYDNTLQSISSVSTPIKKNFSYSGLFDPYGSSSIAYLPIDFRGLRDRQFVNLLLDIVQSILDSDKGEEVGIIASKRDLESLLTKEYYQKNISLNRVHLSTVHRAQGLTVDYCLFYMPLEASHMDLNINLFNVATSRAKKGTCIITNKSFKLNSNVNPIITQFVSKSVDVTKEFMSLLNKDVEF